MTAICKTCKAEIAQRFVGATVVWGHLTNPKNEHHYAIPANHQPPGKRPAKAG